jgi:hypothetical protein
LGEWSTDGLLLAVGPAGRVFAACAGFVARNGLRLLESQKTFSGLVRVVPGGLEAELRFERRAMLTLNLTATPRRVVIDGRTVDDFAYDPDGRVLKLTLPPGAARITVEDES